MRKISFIIFSMVYFHILAYDFSVDGLYYNLNNGEASVTYYSLNEEEQKEIFAETIDIPEYVMFNGHSYPVTSIDDKAFYGSQSIHSITIPPSIKTINNQAFTFCSNLRKLNIENATYSISLGDQGTSFRGYGLCEGLFSDCPLEEIYLGREVTYLSSSGNRRYPFNGITTLKLLTFGEDVHEIISGLFFNCLGLNTLTIPKSINKIGVGAFTSLITLKNFIIESSDEELELTYPEDIQVTSEGWFPESLEYIYHGRNIIWPTGSMRDNLTPWGPTNFIGQIQLKQLTITESVRYIRKYSYYNCTALEKIEMGDNIKYIGYRAFYLCRNVKDFVIKCPIPPNCEEDALFHMANLNCSLYVPSESLSLYESTDPWRKFLIKDHEGAGIGNFDFEVSSPLLYMSPSGINSNMPFQGINIVLYSNGQLNKEYHK